LTVQSYNDYKDLNPLLLGLDVIKQNSLVIGLVLFMSYH